MNLGRKEMRNLMLLILFGAAVYVGLQKVDILLNILEFLIEILFPFLLGAAFAFVLNVPMSFLERNLFSNSKKKKSGMTRLASLLLSLVFVISLILVVILVVVPELGQTFMTIGASVETAIPKIQDWAVSVFHNNTAIVEWIRTLEFDWNSLINTAVDFLKNGAGNFLNSTVAVARTLVNVIVNFCIAIVFAFYILLQKEKLCVQIKKAMFAYLPEKIVRKALEICSLSYKTFSNFVTGQCVEAVILGTMFFLTLSLLRFPYAMLIGVLIAFTALIPIFGAFIGCVIGAFLILIVDPMKGLAFIVIFFILQQVEGNLIYPHVVGNSVGLPSIWVLVAVTVGGSLMGVVGMLLFIPVTSVLYALFRHSVYKRLEERKIHDI